MKPELLFALLGSLVVSGLVWIWCEIQVRHLAMRLGFGFLFIGLLLGCLIALWRFERSAIRFHEHHNFVQAVAAAQLAIEQGRSEEVSGLFLEYRNAGKLTHSYQGVSELRQDLLDLVEPMNDQEPSEATWVEDSEH